MKELGGEFDFVYIDGDQMEFEAYVRPIIDRRLLSQRGVLLADDGERHFRTFHRSRLIDLVKQSYCSVYAWTKTCQTCLNRIATGARRLRFT